MEKTAIKRFVGKNDFMSNFYPCRIEYEGITYPSVEHAFQAAKTFDEEKRRQIAECPTPKEAKAAGRRVKLRGDWNEAKVGIMYELLIEKFEIPELKEKLLGTGDLYLEEGNIHRDKFWGTYMGEGENMLGKLLMKVREHYKGAEGCAKSKENG